MLIRRIYKTETFKTKEELVEFLNKNSIKKRNIIKIDHYEDENFIEWSLIYLYFV